MALFLSQIKNSVRNQLWKRIAISGRGQPMPGIATTTGLNKYWFSERKPWIRFSSGAMLNIEKGGNASYTDTAAINNVLFGGILNSKAIGETQVYSPTTDEWGTRYTATVSDFTSTGLRGSFNDSYIGHRKVPNAGITSISVQNKGDLGSLREAKINWVCYDENQFDILQKLYMVPGISCLIEWGWSSTITGATSHIASKFFDFKENTANSPGDTRNPYSPGMIRLKASTSEGCYDACVGLITNFNWTFNKDTGGYDCVTELSAPGDAILGMELAQDDDADVDAKLMVTDMDAKDWFTPATFQAYINGSGDGGLTFEKTGWNVKIDLQSDIEKVTNMENKSPELEELNTISQIGSILNCTWRAGDEDIPLAYQIDLETTLEKVGQEHAIKTSTTSVGTFIREMEYPEISRYNGWSDLDPTVTAGSSFTAKTTGAYKFGDNSFWIKKAHYITWAFFEEMLINQFYCPKDFAGNANTQTNMMMMRSCNVIDLYGLDLLKSPKTQFYNNLAKANSWWIQSQDKENYIPSGNKAYESVKIGMHPHLRSADGGVMWIPGSPDPVGSDSQLIDTYDQFTVADCVGRNYETSAKDSYDGYLRNLMINIDAIKASFNKDSGAATLQDGLKDLLGKINSASCDYWDLILQCDEGDGGTKMKVIDKNWVETPVQDLLNGSTREKRPFQFPVFTNNSIVSNISMTSKLPDDLKAAIFVGGSRYNNRHQSATDGPEDGYDKLAEDVIDRYYHFGPSDTEEVSVSEQAEREQKERLDAAEARREIKKLGEKTAAAPQTELLDSKAKNYIKQLIKNEPRYIVEEEVLVENPNYTYNQYKNNRLLPVDLSLTLDGISGIVFGNAFRVSQLPRGLQNRLVFQVKNVKHTVNNDTWVTNIESLCRISDEQRGALPGGKVIRKKKFTTYDLDLDKDQFYFDATKDEPPVGYENLKSGKYEWREGVDGLDYTGEMLYRVQDGQRVKPAPVSYISNIEARVAGEPFYLSQKVFRDEDRNYYYIDEISEDRIYVSIYLDEGQQFDVGKPRYLLADHTVADILDATIEMTVEGDYKDDVAEKGGDNAPSFSLRRMSIITPWFTSFFNDIDEDTIKMTTDNVKYIRVDQNSTVDIYFRYREIFPSPAIVALMNVDKNKKIPVWEWTPDYTDKWSWAIAPEIMVPKSAAVYGGAKPLPQNQVIIKGLHDILLEIEKPENSQDYFPEKPFIDGYRYILENSISVQVYGARSGELIYTRVTPGELTWDRFLDGKNHYPHDDLIKGNILTVQKENYNHFQPAGLQANPDPFNSDQNGLTYGYVPGTEDPDRFYPGDPIYWNEHSAKVFPQYDGFLPLDSSTGRRKTLPSFLDNNKLKFQIMRDGKKIWIYFKGTTNEENMRATLDILKINKEKGTLVVVLQAFHLYANSHGDNKLFNGNIWKWLIYEHYIAENIDKLLYKDFGEVLHGIYFWELDHNADRDGQWLEPQNWDDAATQEKVQGRGVKCYWGQQGDHEAGFYYDIDPWNTMQYLGHSDLFHIPSHLQDPEVPDVVPSLEPSGTGTAEDPFMNMSMTEANDRAKEANNGEKINFYLGGSIYSDHYKAGW